MANMLQSSQTTATQAPTYYTDYLANLAGAGAEAQKAAQYVGAQPLQEQAFQQVGTAGKAYQPTLEQAGTTLGQAAGAVSPLQAGAGYLAQAAQSPGALASTLMSPYMQNVVNAIGDIGARNIQQNILPTMTSGAVGGGQYGSQRAGQAIGQALTNAQRDILNQQYQALNQGYNTALQTAEQQNQLLGQLGSVAGTQAGQGQQNLTQAGTALGNLAAQNQNLSLADINALATLGAQQQTIAQNQQTFPLTTLSTLASLMSGQQIPTSTSTQLNLSPLSALASLGANAAGINQMGGSLGGALGEAGDWLKKHLGLASPNTGYIPSSNPTGQLTPEGLTVLNDPTSPTGYVDSDGNPVNRDGTLYEDTSYNE